MAIYYCTSYPNMSYFYSVISRDQVKQIFPSSPPCLSLTSALAAFAVWSERPALVAGTLNSGLLLHAALAALEMLGAEALNLAGLVVGTQLHASWAGAQDALTRCDGTVVAAASIIHRAKI